MAVTCWPMDSRLSKFLWYWYNNLFSFSKKYFLSSGRAYQCAIFTHWMFSNGAMDRCSRASIISLCEMHAVWCHYSKLRLLELREDVSGGAEWKLTFSVAVNWSFNRRPLTCFFYLRRSAPSVCVGPPNDAAASETRSASQYHGYVLAGLKNVDSVR